MKTLRNATDDELAAELARRKAGGRARPTHLPVIEWATLLRVLDDYVAWCASEDFHEDLDGRWRDAIYEVAVRCAFSESFWAWKRSVHP